MRLFSIVILWMLAGIPPVSGQAKAPSIAFDNVSRDLGRITQGEAVRQVFSFSNKGSGTLEIISVEPS